MGENAKYDQGKNRLDLVFPSIIEELGKIRTYGVNKYKDPDNWCKIDNAKQRYTAAAMRHFEAYRKGEEFDPESGLRHLSHCACNLMFLIELCIREENECKTTVDEIVNFTGEYPSLLEDDKFNKCSDIVFKYEKDTVLNGNSNISEAEYLMNKEYVEGYRSAIGKLVKDVMKFKDIVE